MNIRIRNSAIFLFSCLAAVGAQCGKSKAPEPPEKIVPVVLQSVSTEAVSVPITSSGLLFSKQQIRLAFKTGGIVEKIFVNEGEEVRAGDVLARLELDEIESRVEQAKSGFEKAQRDYQRTRKLFDDGVATLEQLQNVETLFNVARSTLRIAKYNLEHSAIKAPVDGRILKRLVEENEIVAPGHPVFYFGSGGEEWIVRVGVADRDIIRLDSGDPAIVMFDAYAGVKFPATITEVVRAADPQTGAFEVEMLLNASGRRLAVGFVAQTTITPREKLQHMLIPISALVEAHGNEGAVYTVEADTARKINVILGDILGERVVVLSGLEEGRQVVAVGAPYLKTGDKVVVRK